MAPKPRSSPVTHSAFGFVFSELVTYSQARVTTADQLAAKLHHAGAGVGARILEIATLRDKCRRETRMLGMLQFITSTLWKMLFNVSADSLEKSVEHEDEFMVIDKSPLVNAFISGAPCNCAAYVAGIMHGVLASARFPARVSAHEDGADRTVYLIKFAAEVIEREKKQS